MMTVDGVRYVLKLIGNHTEPIEALWIALLIDSAGTTATGDTIIEPSAEEYTRVRMENISGSWYLDGTEISTTTEIVFPTAVEDWGLIRGIAVCTESESGEVLIVEQLTTPVEVTADSTLTIPEGGISVSFDLDRWTL